MIAVSVAFFNAEKNHLRTHPWGVGLTGPRNRGEERAAGGQDCGPDGGLMAPWWRCRKWRERAPLA